MFVLADRTLYRSPEKDYRCVRRREESASRRLVTEVFSPAPPAPQPAEPHPLEALYGALPVMAMTIARVDRLLPIVALSMADLLDGVPAAIERRIVLQSVNALLDRGSPTGDSSTLGAVAAVLMSHSGAVCR